MHFIELLIPAIDSDKKAHVSVVRSRKEIAFSGIHSNEVTEAPAL